MATTIAELQVIITADSSGLDSAVSDASGKLNELGQMSGAAGQSVEKMAAGYTKAGQIMMAAGAAMLAPMVDNVRQAATLQQAMDQVGVAFGITEGKSAAMDAQFQEMQDTINQVASDTIFGAQDVADAAIQMGKAGVDWETMFGKIGDASDGALGHVADFAAATATDMPMAAKIVATMANQWGMSSDEIGASLDDLTTVFNTTSLGAEDFIGGMANWAPMAKLLGVDFADAASTLGFFKDQGLSAREAGTSLTAMMRAAVKPTDKQAAAMAELGLSTADFFEINDQGVEQLKDFPDILDMINDATKDLSTTQRLQALATIFGLEAFDAAGLGILSNTDDLRELNKEMENNTGIAREQSAALTDNLLGSLEKLQGSYDVLSQKMGEPFLSPLKAGVDEVNLMVDAMASLDPKILGAIGKFATLSGGLLGFGGLAALGTGQVLKLAKTFSDAGLSLGKFTAGLGLAGLALGAGLLAYETDFLGFGTAVDNAMQKAGEGIDQFGRMWDEVFTADKAAGLSDLAAGVAAFGTVMDAAFGTNLTPMLRRASEAIQRFGDQFEASRKVMLDSGFSEIAADISALGHAIDQVLGTNISPLFDDLATKAQIFGDEFQRAREAGLDPLTSSMLGLRDVMSTILGMPLGPQFDNLGSALRSGVDGLGAFKDALSAGDWSTAWDGLVGGIGDLQTKLGDLDLGGKITTAFQGVKDQLGQIDLGGALQGVSDQLMGWFDEIGSTLFGAQGIGPEGIPIEVQGLVDKLGENIASGLQELPGQVSQKLGEAGDLFAPIGDWLGNQWDSLSNQLLGVQGTGPEGIPIEIPGIIDKLASGVVDGITQLPKMMGDKLADVQDFFAPVGDWLGGQWTSLTDSLLHPMGVGPQGVPTEMPNILDQLAGSVVDGITELPNTISTKLGDVKDFFAPVGEWLGGQWSGLTDSLLHPMGVGPQGIPTEMPGVLDQLATGVVNGITQLPQTISDKLGDAKDFFAPVGEWLQQGFDQAGKTLLGDTAQAGLGGTGAAEGVIPQLAQNIADGFKQLPQLVGDALQGVDGPAQAVGDWLDAQISEGGGFDTIHDSAVDWGTEAMNQINEGMTEGVAQGMTAPGGPAGLGGGPSGGGKVTSGLADQLNAYKDGLIEEADKVFAVTPEFTEAAGKLGENLGTNFIKLISDGIKANFGGGGGGKGLEPDPSIFDALGNFGGALSTGIAKELRTQIEAAAPGFKDFLGQQVANLFDFGDEIGRQLSGGFDSMAGPGERQVEGAIPKLLRGIVDSVGPQFSKLPDMIGTKLQEIKPFEKLGTWMEDSLRDFSRALVGGMDSMAGPGERMIEGAIPKAIDSLTEGFVSDVTGMGDRIMGTLKNIPNPFEGVQTWLQDGLQEITDFFQGPEVTGPGGLGGGPMGAAAPSGIEQMFTGMVEGIGAGMDAATAAIPKMLAEKKDAFGAAIGDLLGPIGQLLFPSEDVKAAGESVLGDPGKLGEQFGTSLVNTFGDKAFIDGLNKSIETLPPDTFAAMGSALLKPITEGIGTAMQTVPADAQGKAQQGALTGGQQMVKTIADGLTTSLGDISKVAPDTFVPAATGLLTGLNTAIGTAMMDQGPGATSEAAKGTAPLGAGMGQQMVQSLATGLTNSLMAVKPEVFQPVATALGTALGTAMSTPVMVAPKGVSETAPQQTAGFGQLMAEGMATGLAAGITAAKPEIFTPVTTALGTQLGAAMQATQESLGALPGPAGAAPETAGFGQLMVQGLATGLATGITAADPAMFAPVTNALGTQLGAAMQQTQQTLDVVGGPAGGVGAPQTEGFGSTMVQGLATGLQAGITAAPPEIFTPVASALGAQLNTALQTAMTTTDVAGQTGPALGEAAGGVGQQMLQTLATGLTDTITAAPPETFAPVGAAIGTQLAGALQTAVGQGTAQAGLGGTGGGTDVGLQMGQAVGDMITSGVQQADFTPVGTSISTKLGEALSTAALDTGEVGAQMGESISQMLESAVGSADFSSVGEEIGTKLTDALNEAIQQASESIGEAVQGIVDAITEAMSGIGDAVSEAMSSVEEAVSQMADSVSEATSAVSDAVSEMQSAVEEAASGMEASASSAAEAMDEMSSAAAEAAAAVSAAMAEIAAAMQAAAGAAEAAAGQIVAALNSIVAAAGAAAGAVLSVGSLSVPQSADAGPQSLEVGPDTAPVGEAVTQGFSDGIVTDSSVVTDATAELATLAYDSLVEAVGAGSPAKRFMPVGAAVSQGFMKGMLADAKSRLQSAIGKMAGAVSSAMGKIHSAMQSGMQRAHSMVQTAMGKTAKSAAAGGDAAGAAAAGGMSEGMDREAERAERAADRMWKKALRRLIKGKGEARFLGEEFAREFWMGLMDGASKLNLSGALDSLEGLATASKEFASAMTIAQNITEKAMSVAENAVEAVRAKIAGLKSQFDLVTSWIQTLESELARVNDEIASMDAAAASAASAAADAAAEAAGQARIDAAQSLLDAQKAITAELEKQFGIEFQAAHQAHIAAAQAGGKGPAQADFEAKLAKAQATDAGISASKAQETALEQMLKAVQEEVKAESAARAAARAAEAAAAEAARRAELEARKAALAAELAEAQRIAAAIAQAQHDAQVEYTNTVIAESQKRIDQLQKELHHDKGDPAKVANDRAQLELERQRIDLANQLADALARQAAGGTPEEMAAINAQIDYLNGALSALDDVDVGAMLQEIVDKLGGVATSMSSAATDMGKAAKELGSLDTGNLTQTSSQVADVGTSAAKATMGIDGMAKAYNDVMAKMAADGFEFQAKFKAMVDANQKTAEDGSVAIGTALSDGITGKIQAGGAALQTAMMDGLKGAIDPATDAAKDGGENIANTFGEQMQEKMGTQLSDVHKTLLENPPNGLNPMMKDATTAAEKGGTDIGHGLGTEMKQGLEDKADPFKDKVFHTYDDPIQKGIDDAGKGGNNIGDAMGRGLNDGLTNWAHTIKENVNNIVHNALQAGHDAAGSSRRSRRMMELGDSMGLGLIYGLNHRQGEAEDASAALVHIPRINPTSDGGTTGSRAHSQPAATTIHIEHLELPSVTNPQEFLTTMERMARMNGVSSGRQ